MHLFEVLLHLYSSHAARSTTHTDGRELRVKFAEEDESLRLFNQIFCRADTHNTTHAQRTFFFFFTVTAAGFGGVACCSFATILSEATACSESTLALLMNELSSWSSCVDELGRIFSKFGTCIITAKEIMRMQMITPIK
jgi:hypothetical protein